MNFEKEFPNNSDAKKEETQTKLEAVKTTQVTIKDNKKNSFISKFRNTFVTDGAGDKIKQYVVYDVVIPTITKTIVDIATNSLNILFYGSARNKQTGKSNISYRQYYDRSNTQTTPLTRTSYHSTTRLEPKDVPLPDRGVAEEILMQLDEAIGTYQIVTIADFYDLCRKYDGTIVITPMLSDNNYGWNNLSNAQPLRHFDGTYTIDFPPAMPIH